MARRRYRRYRRKSGRWASNIFEIQNTTVQVGVGEFSGTTTLVTNPVQNNTTTSQIYTIKNVEISAELESAATGGIFIEGITYYIMFVPQGMNVGSDYNKQHPEYIMAYRFYGSCDIETVNDQRVTTNKLPIKVKTRLSRKLNTGDSIILFIKGYNQNNLSTAMQLTGVVRWWTKAN